MSSADAPTAQYAHPPAPVARRSVLQKVRDVALTVMAVLVSVLSAVLLYVLFAAGSAIADFGERVGNSTPTDVAPTEIFEPGPTPTGDNGVPCLEPGVPGC